METLGIIIGIACVAALVAAYWYAEDLSDGNVGEEDETF